MAEVVRPKFEVVRGWAGGTLPGSAYDRHFDKVVDGTGAALKIKQGTVVTYSPTVSGAVTPATTNTTPMYLAMVVEGNDPADSYAGDYLDKVVAIRGDFEVLLSETMFTPGAYTPGAGVYINGGKVALATTQTPVGYVTSYDAASKLLQVAFNF